MGPDCSATVKHRHNHWYDKEEKNQLERAKIYTHVTALPVVVFAFTCHQNIFSVCSELAAPTKGRMSSLIDLSVACCYACYVVLGLSGYLSFGQATATNVLKNCKRNVTLRDYV